MNERLRSDLDDDALLDAVRSLAPLTETTPAPPDDLWDRIAGSLSDAEDARSAPGATEPSTDGVVVPFRRRGRQFLAAAAAALVVAAVGIGALVFPSDDEPAGVTLEALAGGPDGRAELVAVDDGFVLEVSYEGEPGEGEFLELWLIDTAVTEPRSLGVFDGPGTYEVPSDIDPEQYPVVDISVELDDGDPTHSGDSVVRGELA